MSPGPSGVPYGLKSDFSAFSLHLGVAACFSLPGGSEEKRKEEKVSFRWPALTVVSSCRPVSPLRVGAGSQRDFGTHDVSLCACGTEVPFLLLAAGQGFLSF